MKRKCVLGAYSIPIAAAGQIDGAIRKHFVDCDQRASMLKQIDEYYLDAESVCWVWMLSLFVESIYREDAPLTGWTLCDRWRDATSKWAERGCFAVRSGRSFWRLAKRCHFQRPVGWRRGRWGGMTGMERMARGGREVKLIKNSNQFFT